MNKKNLLLVGVASLSLLLAGCQPNTSSSDPSGSGSGGEVVEDEYNVIVTVPNGVEYTVNKNKAKRGEAIEFVITSVANGLSIKDVKMNGIVQTAEADGKTYKFNMPNRSASIVVRVSVTGDVVIDGDFAAAFTETSAGSGIYEAKNVKVPSTTSGTAFFDIKVGETKLKALDLDESISFGDIGITYGSTATFSIATGSTYDFVYDTNKDIPLSIQRVKVDELPNNADALESVLIGGSYSVRSEPAMFVNNLTGINYRINERSTTDVFKHNFEWKRYADNTTLATIEDEDEERNMYVYRHLDETNKTYSVVDTYARNVGSKMANDDRFRESYNNYGAYSARYDVLDDEDDYGYRFAKNMRTISRELRSSSHMPVYLIEADIMYSYRVGVTADDVKYSDVKIVSTPANGGFKTTIDSIVEYGDTSSSGSTSVTEQALVYDVDLEFDVRGAMTKLTYKKTLFTKDQWDFAAHKALTGQTGSTKTKIDASYTYGGTLGTCDFDPSPYFITSIDKYEMVNPKVTAKVTSPVAGDSYVGLEDKLYIQDDTGKSPNTVTVEFTPATALDLWQYGPTSSDNEAVIAKTASDVYYQMSVITEGEANVTFTNHVTAPSIQGATKTVKVHALATEDIRSFYIQSVQGDSSYAPVETSWQANVHANGTYKFRINSSPSAAPLVYTAVSNNPEYLTITSSPNSPDLVISTVPAKDITSNVKATVTVNSTRYGSGFGPTTLEFYILPAQADPVGTWNSLNYPDTHLYFTNEAYEGSTVYKKGSIVDHYYDQDGNDKGTDTFYFYYKYDGASIEAKIYALDIHTTTTIPAVNDMFIDFYYEASTGRYGVFLAETEYDDYYEDVVYNPILGTVDETYTIITSYDPFEKVL